MTPNYETLNEALPERFPELRASYDREVAWWGNERPGPHIVYERVLIPFILDLLKAGAESRLAQVFEFIESLVTHADKLVREVAVVTVIEHLGADADLLAKTRRHFGPATEVSYDEL